MGENVTKQGRSVTRRTLLAGALAAPATGLGRVSASSHGSGETKVVSPNGRVRFSLLPGAQNGLSYQVFFHDKAVIDTSPLGIIVDGVDLCRGVEVGAVTAHWVRQKYAWRGVHSVAINHYSGAKIDVTHSASGTRYTVEIRAFDNGVAFRYVIPGSGPRVVDESTQFVMPDGSVLWYHDLRGHYEGVHARREIANVQPGEWAAPPVTMKLPQGGYGAITEAALVDYAGMALQAGENRTLHTKLGHAHPASYPFTLRYGEEEAKRLSKPAAISGTITSPWRVIMVATDLNALVNCDIVHNLAHTPDKKLFPKGFETDWLKPGRCVWKYLDGGESTLEGMKEFSRLAGQLGFEHNLIEGFWQRWTVDELRDLVAYSKEQKVGIWLWKHSKQIRDPHERRKFFSLCREVGVVGVKLDFFDHEAKEVIDLYQAALRDAAEFKLMVDFHGANKPAGESRTWPNEMTREGIYGLEHRRTESWARQNTTMPFTRMLAGHADYTPVHFGDRRGDTSWAHQIASAAILTSPLLVYGAHPKNLLATPAVDVIKSIPCAWDETIALPLCEIGELAAFARRKGTTWFLAIMNSPVVRTVRVPLSFLDAGKYEAVMVRDRPGEPAAVRIEKGAMSLAEALTIEMGPGGGFVGRFVRS